MSRDEIEKQIKDLKDEIETEKEQIEATKIYIDNLELEIEALEEKLEKKKPPVVLWKPEEGDYYYYYYYFENIYGFIDKRIWRNANDNNIIRVFRKIFPTEKLAELKRDINLATMEYKRKVAEFNGDWEPDWEDDGKIKRYLHHNYRDNTVECNSCYIVTEPEKEGYYFSQNIAYNTKQIKELKELYQKIIDLTKEYKKAERKWRND